MAIGSTGRRRSRAPVSSRQREDPGRHDGRVRAAQRHEEVDRPVHRARGVAGCSSGRRREHRVADAGCAGRRGAAGALQVVQPVDAPVPFAGVVQRRAQVVAQALAQGLAVGDVPDPSARRSAQRRTIGVAGPASDPTAAARQAPADCGEPACRQWRPPADGAPARRLRRVGWRPVSVNSSCQCRASNCGVLAAVGHQLVALGCRIVGGCADDMGLQPQRRSAPAAAAGPGASSAL